MCDIILSRICDFVSPLLSDLGDWSNVITFEKRKKKKNNSTHGYTKPDEEQEQVRVIVDGKECLVDRKLQVIKIQQVLNDLGLD